MLRRISSACRVADSDESFQGVGPRVGLRVAGLGLAANFRLGRTSLRGTEYSVQYHLAFMHRNNR
jgi:hypothetical protein